MEIIEAPAFTRHLHEYLDDENYRALQAELIANPEAGAVMPGTGGFRKMRWIDQRRGKGRTGGLRIIYFYFETDRQIWLVTLYSKDEAADLSAKEKRALKSAIEAEIKMRAEKHSTPRRQGRTQ
jgi:hypothetical protein